MKILFVNPPQENTIASCQPKELEEGLDYLPPLGLMYLAGYLKKYSRHQAEILDCAVEQIGYQKLTQIIKTKAPDAVGITAMTFTLLDVLKTAALIKQINPSIRIILGGPHVNIYPEETLANKNIDFLVLGEGEKTLAELLNVLEQEKEPQTVNGVAFRKNNEIMQTPDRELTQDLDCLPYPARDLLPYKKYFSVISDKRPVTTMFTSRGCPFKCLFCDRPHLGKKFRARSSESVVREMKECEKMGIKEIFIYDDTFTIDRERVVKICRAIIQEGLGITWDIRARVDTIDKELLSLMQKANCQRIHYGVEAGTEKILKVLRKDITLKQVKNAFAWTKKQNIQTAGYFMLGSPTETREDILETIKLAKKLNPDFVHFSITTPFPATDLYRLGLAQKILSHDYWREFAQNPRPDFITPVWEETLKQKELLALLKHAYRAFYFRPRYIAKRLRQLSSLSELVDKARAFFRLWRI